MCCSPVGLGSDTVCAAGRWEMVALEGDVSAKTHVEVPHILIGSGDLEPDAQAVQKWATSKTLYTFKEAAWVMTINRYIKYNIYIYIVYILHVYSYRLHRCVSLIAGAIYCDHVQR